MMRLMSYLIVAQMVALLGCSTSFSVGSVVSTPPDQESPPLQVLVFSKTAGFRHASTPTGVEAIKDLGEQNGFTVEATEDSSAFTDANLARFSAVVFLSTTGDILNDDQQTAFERYIRSGGGFLGIHAAADTEYDWPWYGRLVGAYFKTHPAIQVATVVVADRVHPSTKHLPLRWQRRDEWYAYRTNPRGKVHVLATLDESTYEGGGMGHDHPIVWCHEFDGGRAFYTGGGHTNESFAEPAFLQHLLGGILWTAGIENADAGATLDRNFDKVVLDDFAGIADSLLDPSFCDLYSNSTGSSSTAKASRPGMWVNHVSLFTSTEGWTARPSRQLRFVPRRCCLLMNKEVLHHGVTRSS